jgi:hypothetical protein
MIFHDGMGPRQSIAAEVLDTVMFGGLNRIRGAGSYAKKKLDRGDGYVIPFGFSSECFGAVIVKSPKNIEVKYAVNGKRSSVSFKKTYDVKRFLVRKFVE